MHGHVCWPSEVSTGRWVPAAAQKSGCPAARARSSGHTAALQAAAAASCSNKRSRGLYFWGTSMSVLFLAEGAASSCTRYNEAVGERVGKGGNQQQARQAGSGAAAAGRRACAVRGASHPPRLMPKPSGLQPAQQLGQSLTCCRRKLWLLRCSSSITASTSSCKMSIEQVEWAFGEHSLSQGAAHKRQKCCGC